MRRGAGVAWQGSLRLPLPVVPALSLLQQCGDAVREAGPCLLFVLYLRAASQRPLLGAKASRPYVYPEH